MDQVISRSAAARRFNLFLLGAFAGLALLLAAIGIYGVLAYSVSRRTHEIGIRMALGARPGDVVRMILGQGARVVCLGMLMGMVGALSLGRLLQEMLFEIRPSDPATLGGVVLALGTVAWTASYIPARRATRIEPVVALRHE
jgi:putative ABC transport system permease protein